MTKDFHLDKPTVRFCMFIFYAEILLLIYLIFALLFCSLSIDNDFLFTVFICSLIPQDGLGSFFLLLGSIIFWTVQRGMKLKSKQFFLSKSIPIISITESSISIPIILKEKILFSDLKTIEFSQATFHGRVILETHHEKKLKVKPNWFNGSVNKKGNKLVWLLPTLVESVEDLESALKTITTQQNDAKI